MGGRERGMNVWGDRRGGWMCGGDRRGGRMCVGGIGEGGAMESICSMCEWDIVRRRVKGGKMVNKGEEKLRA